MYFLHSLGTRRSTPPHGPVKMIRRILVSFLLLVSGCSTIVGNDLTPEAKSTVYRVSQQYLGNVILGREPVIAQFIAWSDFLGSGSSRITHDEFSRQLKMLNQKYSPTDQNHPLLGLKLIKISNSGDFATIYFEKADGSSKEEIWISMLWSGNGWIIVEDSLFGKDKLFAKMFPPPANENS